MGDFFKNNAVTLIVGAISFVSIYAVNNYRLNTLETRQDRQAEQIQGVRDQVNDQGRSIVAMQTKIDAINDNVNYIRSRIDAAVK